jgi:hypothetical protein
MSAVMKTAKVKIVLHGEKVVVVWERLVKPHIEKC